MFNFASNTSWTNGSNSDPIIVSDQTSLNNPHKACLNNTPNLKQQYYYNNYDSIALSQSADHDQASTIFSFVYLPPPITPLFEDQNSITQNSQPPHQNHIGLVNNIINSPHHDDPQLIPAAFSMIGDHQPTGKAVVVTDYPNTNIIPTTDQVVIPMMKGISSKAARSNKKKRDHHSKILTRSRPRHRRMRLSIDVARQFFDLQERLGFERGSKTVEWLLFHAKPEIRKLQRESCSKISASLSSSTSNSDREVISGLDQDQDQEAEAVTFSGSKKPAASSKANRKYNRRPVRRSAFDPAAKQARAMARKRARNRTIEKNLTLGVSMDHPPPLMNIQQCQHDHTFSIVNHNQADDLKMSRQLRFHENESESASQDQNLIEDYTISSLETVALQDHGHFYGTHVHDELIIGTQENIDHFAMINTNSEATLMSHEDQYFAFFNAEKQQHGNQSLLYNFNNTSLQNSTIVQGSGISQDQHQQRLDCQFLVKAWNQVCMSTNHNKC